MKPTRAAKWFPLATIAVLAACSVELGAVQGANGMSEFFTVHGEDERNIIRREKMLRVLQKLNSIRRTTPVQFINDYDQRPLGLLRQVHGQLLK